MMAKVVLRGFLAVVLAGAAGLLSGCIADSAEDTDLPWATNSSWEGMAPISSSLLNQYD